MVDASALSDDELIERLERFVVEERERLSDFLACLREADRRRFLAARGYSSTFDFCVRCLKLSEGESFRRIQAARAADLRPQLLSAAADGLLTLSGISLLAPHVRRPDAPELIARAEGKTTREIEAMLAPLAPEPPKRDLIREVVVATPYQEEARVEFKFQGSRELRAALERVKELLSHRCPSGALEAVLLEITLDYLRRHDPEGAPPGRRAPVRGSSGIKAATRRSVWARDGGRCSYSGQNGVRCESRHFLELDHVLPRALGGADEIGNLRLLCRAHNDSERRRILGEGTPISSLPQAARSGSPGSPSGTPDPRRGSPRCASP